MTYAFEIISPPRSLGALGFPNMPAHGAANDLPSLLVHVGPCIHVHLGPWYGLNSCPGALLYMVDDVLLLRLKARCHLACVESQQKAPPKHSYRGTPFRLPGTQERRSEARRVLGTQKTAQERGYQAERSGTCRNVPERRAERRSGLFFYGFFMLQIFLW